MISPFVELLESKIPQLREYSEKKLTHKIFTFSDEYDAIKNRNLNFQDKASIDSDVSIDYIDDVSSYHLINKKDPNVWTKSLLFAWFSYNRGDNFDSMDSLWEPTEETEPFYIAVNILRHLVIKQSNSYYEAYFHELEDIFHGRFPNKKYKIPQTEQYKILNCESKLDTWIYNQILKIVDDNKELWTKVCEHITYLIPHCLYVLVPLVYQLQNNDNKVIISKGNYGLIVRSMFFGCVDTLCVESEDIISKLWNEDESIGYTSLYYTLDDGEERLSKKITNMLSIKYDIEYGPSDVTQIIQDQNLLSQLISKYEHQMIYQLLVNIETEIEPADSDETSKELLEKKLDKIGKIREHIKKNSIIDIFNYEFGLYENLIMDVFGEKYKFDVFSYEKFAMKRHFDMIIKKCDEYEERITDGKNRQGRDILITVRPDLSARDDTYSSVLPSVRKFTYSLMELFQGDSKVIFNKYNITVGNNINYPSNIEKSNDIENYHQMNEFLDKLKTVHMFIDFMRLSRIYNYQFYNNLVFALNNLSFNVINEPKYNQQDITLFGNFVSILKPKSGDIVNVKDVISVVTTSLNIALFENSLGFTGMRWFSREVERVVMAIESETNLNNILEAPQLDFKKLAESASMI